MTEDVVVVEPAANDTAPGSRSHCNGERMGIGPCVIIVPERGLASKEGLSATGKFKTCIADCILTAERKEYGVTVRGERDGCKKDIVHIL
jgi:hypothetical protein